MSRAERTIEASSGKQVNENAMRANERTDKPVAQFLRLGSWLICPTVEEGIEGAGNGRGRRGGRGVGGRAL